MILYTRSKARRSNREDPGPLVENTTADSRAQDEEKRSDAIKHTEERFESDEYATGCMDGSPWNPRRDGFV